ncbi:hypothetical protein [Roseateles sp. LYH14W]
MQPSPALTQASQRQSRTVRELGLACCAYLLTFSGAVLAWLQHAGLPLDSGVLAICALPPLAGLALWTLDASDARQYSLHMATAMMALPIALMFWAGSLNVEPAQAPPAAPTLDAQQLFDGAETVADTDLRAGGIQRLRTGRFADGSELRLSRFADAAAARNYLAMLSQAMPNEPFTDAGRQGLRLRGNGIGAVEIVYERHGADLLELRAADRSGLLARLAAQRVPLPQEDAAAAPAEPVPAWPFFTAMTVAHGLAFVALIAWAGSHTTRVPALQGAAVATPDELRARLLSLGAFDFTEIDVDGAPALRIDASPGKRRTHHITLHIDAGSGTVRVHEKLGVDGDAPMDAAEASLRGPGDELFDVARPAAQKVWSSTLQATMVEPSRLAAVPLQLQHRHAALPADYAARLDGEGVLTALCAVVTRSGWHWQPRLFGRRI